jgi:uncharacterized protein (DUF2235 family)
MRMKRIAICMDGTWQKLRQDRPTNINIISRSVSLHAGEMQQIVIYTPGVGSTVDALQGKSSGISGFAASLGAFVGGVFGDGLEDAILDTYLRLAFNYEPGDEIYIFGFSRGAFSARSLAALIGKCGILSRRFAHRADEAFQIYRDPDIKADSGRAVEFRTTYGKQIGDATGADRRDYRPQIAYLGIFDTVGQRGLPSALGPLSEWGNRKYSFHNLDLGGHVHAARHALAIDERRSAFPPTFWTNLDQLNTQAQQNGGAPDPYQQRWFVGAHGDVGGGNQSTLSAFPLAWIVEGAERAGLAFDRTPHSPLTQHLLPVCLDPAQPITRPPFPKNLSPINWSGSWRKIAETREPVARDAAERTLHSSVALRIASPALRRKPYRPPPLKPFADALREIAGPIMLMHALIDLLNDHPKKKQGWFG